MRIFIIARGYPTPQYPQWGCFEKDQAEALAAFGHEVIMLSVDTRFRLSYRKIGVTERFINGVHSLDCFLRPGATYIGYIRRLLSVRLQLLYLYKKAEKKFGKPDILYSHYLRKSYEAVWLSQRVGVPIVGIEHWSELNRRPLPLQVRIMGRYTYPRLNALIAVSDTLAQSIAECFGNRQIHVVHNTIGTEISYHPTDTHPFTFIATGSLIHRKGFDLLPQAFAQATNLPADWRMYILGEGTEKANLQTQINNAHLSQHIFLLGRKNKEEIATLLNQADAFILPSRNENFSVAVLEALACGLPVIASICGGIRECIDERNGLLFEVDDVQGLTHCLEHMYAHYREYDRAAIAADCDARFSPRVIAQQLTTIFEQTLATSNL